MATEYTVQKILERVRLTDAGALEKVYRVEATTAGGVAFTMDLTEVEAEPANAAKILKAKALSLDKLLTL